MAGEYPAAVSSGGFVHQSVISRDFHPYLYLPLFSPAWRVWVKAASGFVLEFSVLNFSPFGLQSGGKKIKKKIKELVCR